MNNLENEFFQKETDIEIKKQLLEIQKRYEEVKSLDALRSYLQEETQKVFKKAFIFLNSISDDEAQLNSKELNENKESLREKEEANKKILSKILDFKAILDSLS